MNITTFHCTRARRMQVLRDIRSIAVADIFANPTDIQHILNTHHLTFAQVLNFTSSCGNGPRFFQLIDIAPVNIVSGAIIHKLCKQFQVIALCHALEKLGPNSRRIIALSKRYIEPQLYSRIMRTQKISQ